VSGHGNLVFPLAWWDKHEDGWRWDEYGGDNHLGCGVLDLPDDTEFSIEKGKEPDCMDYWFSNDVKIPGKATIPDEFAQNDITCIHQAGHHHDQDKKFPWNSPGTAPVFGPCGSMGGMPDGCDNDGEGHFGNCCSSNCDTFEMGKNAEEYAWHNPPVTEWKAGSFQEVAWYCNANHAGGYQYRLCKLPRGGIKDVNEECFQQQPLEFVGNKQWVQYLHDRKTGHRTEVSAQQTTEGTSPSGSMWRLNPLLPHYEEGGSSDYGHGHIIDNVVVPDNLELGDYVLSFRWDSKCTPQVWLSCANIRIV